MSEEQQTPVVLDIRKLYAGDMSVEVPHAPEIFQQELNPEISLGVATKSPNCRKKTTTTSNCA